MTELLYEAGQTEPRFRLVRVLPSSQRARLVIADDLVAARAVILKAPSFRDDGERKARDAALALEAQVAAAADWSVGAQGDASALSSPDDTPQPPHVAQLAPADAQSHACLVLPYVEGERLDRWASTHHPHGAPLEVVLPIALQLLDALRSVHEAGFVHRRLSPEHVMVREDGSVQLVGFGGATVRNAGYPGGLAPYDPAYTAPECRTEVSGRFNVPKADVFSLGLVMAYLATGERPSTNAGAPLTRTAAERLLEREVSLSLLIGKCLQPLQKNRMALRALRPHLEEPPSEKTPGFGPIELVATWRQEDPSALPVGTLSPGPLVNRSNAPAPHENDAGSTAPTAQRADSRTTPVAPDASDGDEKDAATRDGTNSIEGTQAAPPRDPTLTSLDEHASTAVLETAHQQSQPWARWALSALIIAVGVYLATRHLH